MIQKKKDIFILQFLNGKDLSFSNGKIESIKDNIIKHNASTYHSSSGSPIIIRNNDNCIIGLYKDGIEDNKKQNKYSVATIFDSILDDIKDQIN